MRELNPVMRRKIAAVLADLTGHNYRPRIQCAWRSPADQLAAYRNGYSKLRWGFHNATAGGEPDALAADILDDDRPLEETRWFMVWLARSARAHGLKTGLLWGVPAKMQAAIYAAIDDPIQSRVAAIRPGWDPLHCEPAGLSVASAKAGERPV